MTTTNIEERVAELEKRIKRLEFELLTHGDSTYPRNPVLDRISTDRDGNPMIQYTPGHWRPL